MTAPFSKTSFACLVVLLTGCASNGLEHRPVVEGNDLAFYERDLKICQEQAANDKTLDKTEEAGILGAAAGAIVGAVADDTLGGAVVGAILGVAGGKAKAQQEQREYIIKCMQDLGYNVVADD